ncbi:hypothetical protein WJX73_001164 [Symbiochloris irregularis]|uniref:Uncharacterized protein n=1 Tax=Symbiochloris irregularis TaxID=706552 RepID=A0AAW1P2B5_9CHLO
MIFLARPSRPESELLRVVTPLLQEANLLADHYNAPSVSFSEHTLAEGVFLKQAGLSPYAGSQCRVQPLLLAVLQHFQGRLWAVRLLCVAADVLMAALLQSVGGLVADPSTGSIMAVVYLISPLSPLASNSDFSASIESALTMVAVFLAAVQEVHAAALAAAACILMFPLHLLLLVPLTLLVANGPEDLSAGRGSAQHWAMETMASACTVQNLEPSMGLMWYMSAAGFKEHAGLTRLLPIGASGLVTLPLAGVMSHRPMLLMCVQLVVTSIFRPHPSSCHLALYLALLLPYWPLASAHMPSKFFMGQSLAVILLLQPAMWHQWIVRRAANPNFYFATTLLYAAWQVLFLLQLLRAVIHADLDASRRSTDHEVTTMKRTDSARSTPS